MAIFSYKGYDLQTGQARKGRVDAESVKAAKAKLKKFDRIIVSTITEDASGTKSSAKSSFSLFGGDRVSSSDLAICTRQFATLQSAHVPLDDCLKALTAQVDNPTLRSQLSGLREKISEGSSLEDALSMFPRTFNRLYVNMVKAGESSGKLDLVLSRLADFIEDQNETRAKIFSAAAYPVLMISASTMIVIYLFVKIVPDLNKVFQSLRVTLPWYTKVCIALSEFLINYWYSIPVIGFAIFYPLKRYVSSDQGRRWMDEKILHVPIFGGIVMRVMLSRFTKTLATLLSSGVPIIQALDITKNTITNSVIADVIEQAKISVQEGQSLARTLEKSEKFPPLVTQMIANGEKTGDLESMLEHVSKAYDSEVEKKIQTTISLIEPGMIIVLAAVVIFVVFSLLMPMMGVMSQLRR